MKHTAANSRGSYFPRPEQGTELLSHDQERRFKSSCCRHCPGYSKLREEKRKAPLCTPILPFFPGASHGLSQMEAIDR